MNLDVFRGRLIHRLTAWLTIVVQLFTLLVGSFSSALHAKNTPVGAVNTGPATQMEWQSRLDAERVGYSSDAGMTAAGMQAGSVLTAVQNGQAADVAKGMATSRATAEVQQWLGQYGTARARIDADSNLSLKNSELQLLVPLYEHADGLLFTQNGMHRTDGRAQFNSGLGYRYFSDHWMAGGNVFLDHDQSRGHTRVGMGIEYGRDFLKFGANSYYGLSGWKNSPDLVDYEERPASGWDLRAQGWLPALPQLGGKLIYEQYYGDEVGLTGANNRQRDPRSLSVGASYTPIPLVTLAADRRLSGGDGETRLALEFNYRPGVPWRQQVDADAVGSLRSLRAGRYDLVDRNNNIVLEYRKQELVSLQTASLVTGYEGEKKSLGVTVTATHGVAQVEWQAAELLAAGGQILRDGQAAWSVTMPAWQSTATANNTYTLSGVAVDNKGNRSARSETQVTVLKPVISADRSTFAPARATYPADKTSVQILTLKLFDAQGRMVDMPVEQVAYSAVKVQSAIISEWVKKEAGWYEIHVKAGEHSETVTITPEIQGLKLASSSITFTAMTADEARSAIATDAVNYASGDTINVSVTLQDAQGKPVTGAAGQLTAAIVQNATLRGSWTDNRDGTYAATFVAQAMGTGLLASLQLPDWSGAVQSSAYTISAGAAAQGRSTLATDARSYVPGDTIGVTVMLQDTAGNPVTGALAQLAAVSVQNASLAGSWTDNGDGTYAATYQAQQVGTGLTASLRLSGWASAVHSAAYAITAGAPVVANSSITTDAVSYASGDRIAVSVTLHDTLSNPVAGAAAQLSAVTVQNGTLAGSWTDNGDGTYQAFYTAQATGTGLTASLQLSNWTSAIASTAYAITAGAAAEGNSTLTTDALSYASGDTIQINITLQDAAGNPVTGASAQLATVTVQNAVLAGSWADNGNGTYAATYTAQAAGTGLKASLRLGGWSGAISSAAYAITAGSAVEGRSTLTTDATTYLAGDNITVSVTLQDNAGNPVTGAAAQLSAVSVQNATLTGSWTDNRDGTYAATFTAQNVGTGLTASLQLSGWSGAIRSAVYAITASAATEGNSTIATDAATYTAGNPISVNVTLQDTAGNPVTGAAGQLAAVIVPNAILAGSWTDNNDGTYAAMFTAQATGTGLMASLHLNHWSGTIRSSAYAITTGAAAEGRSTITTDAVSYMSGDTLNVSVILQDSAGNPVTGATASLAAVSVQNAMLAGSWTESGNGIYAATYTAQGVGIGLTASLRLGNWSGAINSAAYTITAGAAAEGRSTIATDTVSYASGDAITISVTLQDTQGNPVAGAATQLSAVSVQNAVLAGSWTDNGNGTYAASYTAQGVGTGLTASLQLAGWSAAIRSSTYAITAGAAAEGNSTIATNASTYTAGDSISVSVMLQDRAGNPISGLASQLSAVAVQNAALAGSWTDHSDGTYSAAFTAQTAGAGLTASLQLGGWSGAINSSAYAITAGAPAEGRSTMSTDAVSYASGDAINVSVILQDEQGNPVTGAATQLSAAAVQNAVLAGSWTDNGDGTYVAAYTAQALGNGLTASLQLAGWSGAIRSSAYAIMAGAAAEANSTLATDASAYTAGDTISVSVTLQDAAGNDVIGATSQLTAVVVQNAALNGSWMDNGDGTYAATYTAQGAGAGLQASLQLSGWTGAVHSLAYTIVAGAPAPLSSSIVTDAATYIAGGDINVTVSLADRMNNPLVGMAASIIMPSAGPLIARSPFVDNGDGTYHAVYARTDTHHATFLSFTLAEWNSASVKSNTFSLTAGPASMTNSTLGVPIFTSYPETGETITLGILLKDEYNNLVTGANTEILSGVTNPVGLTLVTDWSEVSGGVYRATFVTETPVTGLTLSVRMPHWSSNLVSAKFNVISARPVQANSSVSIDNTSYTVGQSITVTINLRDVRNKPVLGRQSSYNQSGGPAKDSVTARGAQSNLDFVDNGDGSYTGTMTASSTTTNSSVVVKMLEGAGGEVFSERFDVTP
ncbi:hypothetical protein CIG19_20515 [Enterobacterales bacterium CwR94]|nr:hypothetical protein CIG19_20515 [Enterobacterales bacterium CwR94]